jgi:hypothetical protein
LGTRTGAPSQTQSAVVPGVFDQDQITARPIRWLIATETAAAFRKSPQNTR